MNEIPLHPALVHLPIALVLFAPAFALYLLRATPNAIGAPRGWRIVVLWALIQCGVIYATMVTGEQDADLILAARAEQAPLVSAQIADDIAERIADHENAATLLLLGTIGVFFLGLIALGPTSRPGLWCYATVALQLILIAVGAYTARLGGELVYAHGAAAVHRSGERTDRAGH